jgi:acetyltransferase-like isoleucine patch superfamily enzyme
MHERISRWDRVRILWDIGRKVIRGGILRLFLRDVKGLFLVGKHVRITHGRHISCGKMVKFEDYSEIHGLCADGLIFGDYVTVSRGVMIRPSSYYGKDYGAGLVMGEHSSIGPYGYVGCSGKIVIGKNVMFGPRCNLFAENHVFYDIEATIKSQGVNRRGIVIEDDCWIGANCIILDGVRIGRGSVIGAGTLVNKDVQPGSVMVDKRCRCVKER